MISDLISICIPSYNGEKYLQEALDSIKTQTYRNIEVIVSDDDSKDNTLEIVGKFKKDVNFPVYIYSHKPNGIGANWNNCIKKANGEYIQFIFQDDVLEKNCLEVKLNFIKQNNLMAVCSKRTIIDRFSKVVKDGKWYEFCHDLQKIYLNLHFSDFYIFKKNELKRINHQHISANIFGEPIAFLFDKKLFNEIGYFNESYKQILDTEYGYRILNKYPIGFIEEPLFKFRIHDEQASFINSGLNNEEEYKLLKKYITTHFYHFLNFNFKKQIFKEKNQKLYNIYIKFYSFLRKLKQ